MYPHKHAVGNHVSISSRAPVMASRSNVCESGLVVSCSKVAQGHRARSCLRCQRASSRKIVKSHVLMTFGDPHLVAGCFSQRHWLRHHRRLLSAASAASSSPFMRSVVKLLVSVVARDKAICLFSSFALRRSVSSISVRSNSLIRANSLS